jgi:hypothetical protein
MPYLYKNSYVYYMYNTIVNPITGRAVNVNGRTGKMILKQYVNQLGGRPKEGKVMHALGAHDAWLTTRKGVRGAPHQSPLFTFGQAQQPRPGTAPYRRPVRTLPTSAAAASVTAAWGEMTRPPLGQWELLGTNTAVQVVRIAGTTADPARQARRHLVGYNKGSIQIDSGPGQPPHELPLYQLRDGLAGVSPEYELESANAKLHNFLEGGVISGLIWSGEATQKCPKCIPFLGCPARPPWTPLGEPSFTKCARNAYALQGDINTLVKYYKANAEFENKFAHHDAAQEAQGLTAHAAYWATFPNIISAPAASSPEEEKLHALSRQQARSLRRGKQDSSAMGEHYRNNDDGVGTIRGAEIPGQYDL